MRRETVGVVGRRGHHREDLAGGRLQRDDGALDVLAHALEAVVRRGLRLGVDGQGDRAALGLAVAEHVDDPVDEQPRVGAGEDLVLARLDGGAAVDVGVVAGDRGVLQGLAVAALVLVLVVDLLALGDRRAAGHDRPALVGELRVAHPLVVAARVEAVGLEVLQVGAVEQQGREQQHAEDRHRADRLVHLRFTTWVESSSGAVRSGSGLRAWSEIRSSSATIAQLATSDDPP